MSSVLHQITKGTADSSKQNIVTLLRRWKQIDVNITESANEAKDNVKYLFTLERFIDPLYTGSAEMITDTFACPDEQYQDDPHHRSLLQHEGAHGGPVLQDY